MTEPLKLAFIGGGINSAIGQTHFAASQLDGCWEVMGGAFSQDMGVCEQTAQQWRLKTPRLYDSWEKMLSDPAFHADAVAVLTPTPDHFPVLKALLGAKIPVICEKALVQSVEEAEALAEIFDHTRHFLAVTYNYSGYPMLRELRHMIQEGRLGRILQLELEMPQEGFLRPPVIEGEICPPQAWRRQDGEIPTLCLDLGVHLHHLAVFLTGLKPVEVMADMARYSQWGVIDHVQLLLRFEEGTRGGMWMSKTALGERNGLRVRIYGEKGSAQWYQMAPEVLNLAWADGRIEQLDRAGSVQIAAQRRYTRMKPGHPAGFVEAFANLYWDFAEALRSWRATGEIKHPYVFGLAHATEGLKLFDAARKSYEQGRWKQI